MKVLITGASGYIGRHVVKAFINKGHEVFASDFAFKGLNENVNRIYDDIFSGDKNIYEQLGCPDALVHLAWRDGFIHNSPAHMKDLSKHVVFLNNMIDGGLKYLSVMGSMHEVGYYEGPIDENTPCNPMTMYGVAKNALRQQLLIYSKDKDVAFHWLRGFYIYGDDVHGSSVFAKLCQAVEDGKDTFPFTTGKNKFDFIHVDELSRQIMAATLQSEYNGIINVCSGKPISLADKIESYIKEHNMNISLDYGRFPERPDISPETWGDATIINKIMEKQRNE